MLALAALVLLAAAAPADAPVRVTGTALRFGQTDSLLATRGFAAADSGREGRCLFFGLDSDARLGLADGRLVRAEFTVEQTSPHQRAYVQDQLAAMGYRRSCERLEPQASDCEWLGPARVRLLVSGPRLEAIVTPREPAAAAAADTGGVAPSPAPPETAAASSPPSPPPAAR